MGASKGISKPCRARFLVSTFWCMMVIHVLGEPDAVADPELAPNVVKCSKKRGVF